MNKFLLLEQTEVHESRRFQVQDSSLKGLVFPVQV